MGVDITEFRVYYLSKKVDIRYYIFRGFMNNLRSFHT